MSWNSNAPMELLSRMPQKLSKSNLEAMQKVIDNDKYLCSAMLERDLCGEYAPFCALCDRSMSTPCAVAYIRMRQAEGIKLEIAVSEDDSVESANSDLAEIEIIPAEGEISSGPCGEMAVEPEEASQNAEEHDESEPNAVQTIAKVEALEPDAPAVDDGSAAVVVEKTPQQEEEESVEAVPKKKLIRIAVAKRKK